jgi:hypothetical protein
MSGQWKTVAQALACAGAAAIVAMAPVRMTAQAPAPGAPAAGGQAGGGGGRGGAPGVGPQLFTAFDADKDGSVTAVEIKTAFDAWYDAADTQKAGSVSQDQLSAALNAALGVPPPAPAGAAGAPGGGGGGRGPGGGGRGSTEFVAGSTTPGLNDACGGRSQQPAVPCPSDVEQMMAILPSTAPAKPLKAPGSDLRASGGFGTVGPLAAKAVGRRRRRVDVRRR